MWNDDTPVFQVSGSGLRQLHATLELAVGARTTAKGWAVNEDRMALFWAEHKEMTAFPAPLIMRDCAALMMSWLEDGDVDFGKPLDHDGDSGKGWLVFTEGWGHVAPWGYQAFIAVSPHWQHFGK